MSSNDPSAGASISSHSRDYSAGFRIALHSHGADQLVYASAGVMRIESGSSLWLIPPQFGLWIPAGIAHEIRMESFVSMRTVYFRAAVAKLAPVIDVLFVRPLFRELVLETVKQGSLGLGDVHDCAMETLLLRELSAASRVPTGISLPTNQAALSIARRFLKNPAADETLAGLCAEEGIGLRTLQRIFRREAGVDFESWRRQVRLMKATQLLVEGSTVKEAAYAVGYSQPTALVELFKLTFNMTPKAWVKQLGWAG